MAATAQMLAAVVTPLTSNPVRKIVPAPRKPIPVTTWAATRSGAGDPNDRPASLNSSTPRRTIMCVSTQDSRDLSLEANQAVENNGDRELG